MHRLDAPGNKRWVFNAISSCFFCSDGSIRRALTQATRRYHFSGDPPSNHLVLAWFRTGGGMRHGHMIKGQQGRNDASSLSHHLLRERVIIIIILRGKKHIGKNINTHSRTIRKAGDGFGWVRRYLFLTWKVWETNIFAPIRNKKENRFSERYVWRNQYIGFVDSTHTYVGINNMYV